MTYTIIYYSDKVQQAILDLPSGLRGRYFALTDRMELHDPNLGEPKKTDKTPAKEKRLAETRMKEVKNHADTR